MHVRLNGKPLEEVDCFKCLGSQVAADEGCEMGYKTWGVLKSVLSSSGLEINVKCVHEEVIVPTALYRAEAWWMRSVERR